ncbi:hypothetical protein ILUMI_19651 [Ignelater luminosus]|uniref:Uncharacterized protein n=1 Tax=Ignelater luminosus TaxID=2038154 RepID=A0A8K0CM05_IGNLU|nr:hypothetical protein ILUMI_19651 [Ignelater luminosus]
MQRHQDDDINKRIDNDECFLLKAEDYSEEQRKDTLQRKCSEELTFATQMKLRAESTADAAKAIKDLISPKRTTKYKRANSSSLQVQTEQITPLKALCMFVEAGLSRRQYKIIKSCQKKLYPCYSILQKTKQDYPTRESYRVTATCTEVNLQDLLDHTVSRLLLHLTPLNEGDGKNLTLICKYFHDPDLSGVDYRLIHRLKVILGAISSGFRIDTNGFDTYCMETAKLYAELYSWQPMTPILHKILMRGSLVIEKELLPIGQLTEEAAEARKKHFRWYRQNYARKFSRESHVPRKTTKPFLRETLKMLFFAESIQSMVDVSDEKESIIEAEESSDEEPWLSPSSVKSNNK